MENTNQEEKRNSFEEKVEFLRNWNIDTSITKVLDQDVQKLLYFANKDNRQNVYNKLNVSVTLEEHEMKNPLYITAEKLANITKELNEREDVADFKKEMANGFKENDPQKGFDERIEKLKALKISKEGPITSDELVKKWYFTPKAEKPEFVKKYGIEVEEKFVSNPLLLNKEALASIIEKLNANAETVKEIKADWTKYVAKTPLEQAQEKIKEEAAKEETEEQDQSKKKGKGR